ncbi:hypothetical protein LTR94_031559, partial [Friedmanniomyces endolithicus]
RLQIPDRGAASRRRGQQRQGQHRLGRGRHLRGRSRGLRGAASGRPCGPGAGRLRQARRGRQDHGRALRPRKQDPLPRHLPGHAGRADRVRPQYGRPAERELDRVRSGNRPAGRGPDHRVAEPRRQGREARREFGPGRHHAPGRPDLRRQSGHAGGRDLRQRRDRASPPSLRRQQLLPAESRSGRPDRVGA